MIITLITKLTWYLHLETRILWFLPFMSFQPSVIKDVLRMMSHSLRCTNDNNLFVGDALLLWDFVVFRSTSRISAAFVLLVESSWQSCWLFWWCEGNRFLFSLHAFRPQQHVNVCVSRRLTVCDVLSMGVSRKLSEMAARPSITAKQRRINTLTHT